MNIDELIDQLAEFEAEIEVITGDTNMPPEHVRLVQDNIDQLKLDIKKLQDEV